MYTAAGSLVNKKAIISLSALLVLALPLSAFAESFTVTTNKDIYNPDEKVIIVGAISEGAPDGYAVLIKVTGASGECTSQHLLPATDNSFISRPIRLNECGLGEFTVLATYADGEATSTFMISNNTRGDQGGKLELRMLKNVIMQAQDAVNGKVRDLIEDGYVLPEEVARKYGEGVSEASLALQAIEFGDAADAKKHMIFALRDFREVLYVLSADVARFEQTAEQQAASSGNSDVVGTYNMLQSYYNRLMELTEKNQVNKEVEFKAAEQLLSDTRQMIDEGNFEAAALNLDQISTLLEGIRAELVDQGKDVKKLAYNATNTRSDDEDSARRLTEAANRFEKTALKLLNETSSAEAKAKLREAASLITNARASVETGQLDSAREDLSVAYQLIKEVEDLIDKGNKSNAGNSNEKNSSSRGNSGKDNNDKSNKGSNSGNSDDQ